MNPDKERRAHARSWCLLGYRRPAARLRTGSPLRVLNTSPDGMLVESPARLLPGRRVDLVLQSGTTREQGPWLVVHSRVGCLRGSSDLRYRVGLSRGAGNSYPTPGRVDPHGHALPSRAVTDTAVRAIRPEKREPPLAGTGFGRPDQS